ncbi:MAG: hypothetical protein FJY66_03435, partial [Calditrichaeota bacterium]|nr:hypothetical protein [Calditrichota bacterium]
AVITRERRLPLKGEVLAKVGDRLAAETIVAKTELPGAVHPINSVNILNISPQELEECLKVKTGDVVKKEQVVAESKSFFGLFKSQLRAPVNGVFESFSKITGQMIFREAPIPVTVDAYLDGIVTQVFPKEGIEIQSRGTFIQGIFGIGGETYGTVRMACSSPDEVLDESKIPSDCRGNILVGGSLLTIEAIEKAKRLGAKAIVVGGFSSQDLRRLLGYDLGVAITGSETIGITLILTEGFGQIAMARRTFELLAKNEDKKASCSGATQIRAGVIRPEIIIAQEAVAAPAEAEREPKGLEVGSVVRVIREPYFGRLGRVTSLPSELATLETEAKVRVLEVEFDNGSRVLLPRANVEMIEE